MIRTLLFTQTETGVTYTAVTSIPAGARLMDLDIETFTAWTCSTAAISIGDADAANSLVSAASVKALQGIPAKAKGGTNWGNGLSGTTGPISALGPGKLYPNGGIITAIVTVGTPSGETGVTRITLWIETPSVEREASVV